MQKAFCAALCLILSLFLATGAALAAGADGAIVNCEEWVSLRAAPDTSARRLSQVPLGAAVTDCVPAGNGFVACVYEGQAGYILSRYVRVEAAGKGAAAVMYVANCEEWVSLRAAPDTSARRLSQVPLGAAVTDCVPTENGFVACVYGGQAGYILSQYLSEAPVGVVYDREAASGAFDGTRVVIETGGNAVCEAVRVTAYAENGEVLWRREAGTPYRTELTLVAGRFGGTAQRPLALLYAAGVGLIAYETATGEEAWRVTPEQVNLGGSLSWVLGGDGTLYVGGYYGPEPVAISAAGEVLWQAYTNEDVYWLYDVQIADAGLLAKYTVVAPPDPGEGDPHSGAVLYDLETGQTLQVAPD